ncbi:MAG: HAD-IA family hydrolase [Pseudorhodoplanes sp.]|nr:HAD-IA family hydrolase [Pseudorhodoplanes sp.]
MKATSRLILFDCDGTLVDSQRMICAAMQQAFDDHGLVCPSREEVLSIVGLSLPIALARLGEGRTGFPVESLVDRYKAAFFTLRQSDPMEELYPGARAAVEALAARGDVVLGIATGKSQRGVRAVLGHHGLLDRFAVIKTADDAPSKPHPGMVLDAMRETGAAPHATVLIGDTTFDMEMARAAGAHALGVGWGYHAVDALRAAGAHGIVESFDELIRTLDRLPGDSREPEELGHA